jgi:hypothetical protein
MGYDEYNWNYFDEYFKFHCNFACQGDEEVEFDNF